MVIQGGSSGMTSGKCTRAQNQHSARPGRSALELCLSVLALVNWAVAAEAVSNADQLVAQHLDSIASAKLRGDMKTRLVQGPLEFKILVGGAGTLDGKTVLISEGHKLRMLIKLPNNEYRGEQFVFDGDKDAVAFATARQTRSAFGNLVFVQNAILREGLLGGVLSTAWPLLDLSDRKPKLSYQGIKTVDGQKVHDLLYHPRKNSDLEIHLYFDVDTGRHVESVYRYEIHAGIVGGAPPPNAPASGFPGPGSADSGGPSMSGPESTPETASARQQTTRYRLQEKFSEFKTVDGVTLPTHYDIQFAEEQQNGHTVLSDWDAKGLEVTNNISLDPRNFEVK